MVVLGSLGILLLVGAPFAGHLLSRTGRDVVGLIRILQVVGIVLLVLALLVRPYDSTTRAIPTPPSAPGGTR
jgi:hypothetical protein